MWMEFMQAHIDSHADKHEPPQFEAPGNIVFLTVDKSNGALLPAPSQDGISEAFISGTQPGGLTAQQ
jgi:membrane carboxypeptidase/penicillin-binding protein